MPENSHVPPGGPVSTGDIFRLVQHLCLSYDLAQNRYRAQLELNDSDLRALNLLRTMDPVSPGILGHYLGLSSAGSTTVLDRLESRGFVSRHAHDGDRRRTVVGPGANYPHCTGPGLALMRYLHELCEQLDGPGRAKAAELLRQASEELAAPSADASGPAPEQTDKPVK